MLNNKKRLAGKVAVVKGLQSDDRSKVCILFARLECRVTVYQIAIVRDMV